MQQLVHSVQGPGKAQSLALASSISAEAEGALPCSSSCCSGEAEVFSLLGMLLPAAESAQRLHQELASYPLQAAQQQQQQPGSAFDVSLVRRTKPEQEPREGQQRQQSTGQRDSHAKVLTWLSISSCEPADIIQATPPAQRSAQTAHGAAAAQLAPVDAGNPGHLPARSSSLHVHTSPVKQRRRPAPAALPASWPAPQPLPRQAHMRRQQPQRHQQSFECCAQLARQAAWQPRQLALARPPCSGCGRAEADCCCSAEGIAPLRLLRPRQLTCGSSSRRLQRRQGAGVFVGSPGSEEASHLSTHHRHPLLPLRAAHAPGLAAPAPGGISIASIGTAYFGSSESTAAPPAVHSAVIAPPCAVDGSGGGSVAAGCGVLAAQGHHAMGHGRQAASSRGRCGLDVWSAYLASRKRPTGGRGNGKRQPRTSSPLKLSPLFGFLKGAASAG